MGKVVPVGKIVGTKVEKEIACSGRQISPDDGTLLIAIPARAVATATPFSIQRLSNTSTGAVGEAYRLLPHGGNFQKSIKFTYNALTTLSFCRNKT
ncbi:MAG: hypothetical protein HWD62_15220 [Cyclobacteriaceae bacterium]|nr:MAG: hypothetical protein HWD62_15220 [Cyclobacteriaceae bacterium]